MFDSYIEGRKRENIRSLSLPNKGKFYEDLINIENSWTGRIDCENLSNAFVMEAAQQIINAIEVFEQGYFDCAYYSLRSAVELATTMVYLADTGMPDGEKTSLISAWKETKKFPMKKEMISQLLKNGNVFIDMKNKMPDFFNSAKTLEQKLNKYVHKQGPEHFYVSRNHPLNIQKTYDYEFIKSFESYLKQCIGVVAVMRLAIDALPIILMDEEILYRCVVSMTEAYSADFVDEYIDQSIIDAYKTTEIYQGTYNFFIREEKKNEYVFNIVNNQYIDSSKIKEILPQLHLMPKDDIICTSIVYACDKVVKIYTYNGLLTYFTDRNTNRTVHSLSMLRALNFENFATALEKINQRYGETYISVFLFDEGYYYAEHNDKLDDDDISRIRYMVSTNLLKLKNADCT
jgi:hypothetical protein